MLSIVKKILIGVATTVAFVLVITALIVGKPFVYIGLTIAILTALCGLVYLIMLFIDKYKKYSETNEKYKVAMEVFKWLGFWWLYVAVKIYNRLKN